MPLPTQAAAPNPDALKPLYQALGYALYALVHVDGQFQDDEEESLRKSLAHTNQATWVMEAFQVLSHYRVPLHEAYVTAFRQFALYPKELNTELKKQFVHIMEQTAQAYDGISRKENELLRHFRRDLNRL